MKDLIFKNKDQAEALEDLYHSNKKGFKIAFDEVYSQTEQSSLLDYWQVRLNYKASVNYFADKNLLGILFGLAILAGLLVKLPSLFNLDESFYYSRNIGFIAFLPMCIYFAWYFKTNGRILIFTALFFCVSAVYINSLTANNQSDTLILACMHLVLGIWTSMAFVYGNQLSSVWDRRMEFLKFNGDLIVMSALLGLAGGILSAITIGLFHVIGFSIESFYFQHIAPIGLAIIPLLASFLIQVNPQLVDKISPLIARIFSPIVLVMLFIYLVAISFSTKNLYTDRDFLLIFNVLLIGVMAIIFFSLSESYKQGTSTLQIWILFGLAILTIIVNSFALSAILFRIDQFGFTPNRLAVLGSNCLMLVNLLLLAWRLFQNLKGNKSRPDLALVITQFIPFYLAWAIIVVYLFPLLFQFK